MRRLVVYTPDTGASVSALCEGEKLRAVSIYEEHGESALPAIGPVRPSRFAPPVIDLLLYLARKLAA